MKEIQERIRIADLIAHKLISTISAAEIIELDEWINASSKNKKEYLDICRSIQESGKAPDFYSMDMNKEWEEFKKEKYVFNKGVKFTILKYAAAIFIPLLIAVISFNGNLDHKQKSKIVQNKEILPGVNQGVLYLANGEKIILKNNATDLVISNKSGSIKKVNNTIICRPSLKKKNAILYSHIEYNILKIPQKGEYSIILADGTKVWLNSETEFKFPETFAGDKRDVYLEGEAYFDVAKNKDKPFIIHINDVSVKVLGTSFNIEARKNSRDIKATLVEGSILMRSKNSSLKIKPNQQIVYNKLKTEMYSQSVNIKRYTSWKDGKFYFENEDLSIILKKMSRWYGVKIVYSDESLKNSKFTMEVKRYENMSRIIKMIEKTEKVRFEIKDKIIKVYKQSR
ncbi:MAG: FecR family protein [Marinifilaceae bacterium]